MIAAWGKKCRVPAAATPAGFAGHGAFQTG